MVIWEINTAFDVQSGVQFFVGSLMMGLVGSMMGCIWMDDTTGTCLGRVCRFPDEVSILAIGAT